MGRRVINLERRAMLAIGLSLTVFAQPAGAQPVAAASAPAPTVLHGRWVRPDGGYTVTVRSVDANGRLDASYANPNPLPFSRAEAKVDGGTLTVFLELRAGGYNGSTYTLRYDPASDTLQGEYFQAVAQQKYPVRFHRLPAQ